MSWMINCANYLNVCSFWLKDSDEMWDGFVEFVHFGERLYNLYVCHQTVHSPGYSCHWYCEFATLSNNHEGLHKQTPADGHLHHLVDWCWMRHNVLPSAKYVSLSVGVAMDNSWFFNVRKWMKAKCAHVSISACHSLFSLLENFSRSDYHRLALEQLKANQTAMDSLGAPPLKVHNIHLSDRHNRVEPYTAEVALWGYSSCMGTN